MEGQEPSTLQQQENMSIKGQSARHLVMQKLMRTQSESVVIGKITAMGCIFLAI